LTGKIGRKIDILVKSQVQDSQSLVKKPNPSKNKNTQYPLWEKSALLPFRSKVYLKQIAFFIKKKFLLDYSSI
jgi:hypothetical protein